MDAKTTPMAGFDLETTGTDVLSDRIVTASIVYVAPDGSLISNYEWLCDPGIRIPEGASEVHGVTTERAWAEGDSPGRVIRGILRTMRYFFDSGVPVVVYNGAYDFSLLNAECVRHLRCTFAQAMGGEVPKMIVDAMVLDKKLDRYRRGSRKLTATAEHYGAALENAHASMDDSLAAVHVAQALWERNPELSQPPLEDLFDLQVEWYEEQSRGLEAYLLGEQKKDPEKYPDPLDFDHAWPIRSA